MADEPILISPIVQQSLEQQAVEAAHHDQSRLATAEEIRAADQLFAQQQEEQQLVSAMLGMYTGGLLLRDLAAEHLSHVEEEELTRLKEKDTAGETG